MSKLLIGKNLDQRGIGKLRQIDGAAIANCGYHLRSCRDRGEAGENLARVEIGRGVGDWRDGRSLELALLSRNVR